MASATKNWVFVAIVLTVAAGSLAAGQNALAGPGPPPPDHYKIYEIDAPAAIFGEAVKATDQFSNYEFIVEGPLRLGVPTDKNGSGFIFPELHYTWYAVDGEPAQPLRQVVYENQFGENVVQVRQPRWLLTPALKNQASPSLPLVNHYLCYDAVGGGLNIPASLINQFGGEEVLLLDPKFFCNPVQKEHAGVLFPILNELDHLVCYDFTPHGTFAGISVGIVDQFVQTFGLPFESVLLCVPSEKTGVTPTDESTWGKVKSIYR